MSARWLALGWSLGRWWRSMDPLEHGDNTDTVTIAPGRTQRMDGTV